MLKSFSSQKYHRVWQSKCLIIWQAFPGSEGLVRVFWCSLDGRWEQRESKIYFQILFIWQEIHQGKCETHILLFTSISYEHKHVSDQSMLVFCFHGHMFVVYLFTNHKSPQQWCFQGTHSTLSTPKIPAVKSPHVLRFSIVDTPPPPPNALRIP